MRYDGIMSSLTEQDRRLILEISRVFKSSTRIFHIGQLERKKSLANLDVFGGLKRLQSLGIAEQVNERRGIWRIAKGATKFYHSIADEELEKLNPDLSAIYRR
jgi:hypothetical protein